MPNRQSTSSDTTRRTSLATCLAAALGLALTTASASEAHTANSAFPGQEAFHFARPERARGHVAKSKAAVPSAPTSVPGIRSVTTCADDGLPGSLRYEVGVAASGDTIDLSQLMCSTITLDGGWADPEIEVAQDTLTLQGPGSDQLTIDGGSHSSVFQHFGAGTLYINDLTIAHGMYISSTSPQGGCIYSSASVSLIGSVVTDCEVLSSGPNKALGGGVFAKGDLRLNRSMITQSHANSINGASASGGGAHVEGDFNSKYSTISDNSIFAVGGSAELIGGISVLGGALISGSTISGNSGGSVGGIYLRSTAEIWNSTISGNSSAPNAGLDVGGIFAHGPLTLRSSTVAFNVGTDIGGLAIYAPSTLQSSIISNNVGAGSASDLGGPAGVTVVGASNLVVSSNLFVPLDTLTACPQLEPLADNGSGLSRTHALRHTSPAIDQGNNAAGLTTDQRLASRVVNAEADIGAVEWQPSDTDERILASGFDGLCDQ